MINPMGLFKNFQQFKADFEKKRPGISPQEEIQRLMSEGKIKQADFETARKMAADLGYKL